MQYWTADPAHSSVEFAVKHMGIATVRGRFSEFDATAELDESLDPTVVSATIKAASITTGADQRDEHLRSPDFFDVEQYPTIEFRSTGIEPLGGNRYQATGDLTMHGVTKPVTLELERTDEISDPWGNRRVAATLTGTLNRKEWGLTWNQVLEFGALMVSEEVKLEITVQVVAEVEATV